MNISQKGINLIKKFEGLRLDSYLCPANVWTIGYGHTQPVNGKKIARGMKIDEVEAERLLRCDLVKFEDGVNKLVKVPMTQGKFDALVSFAFNLGLGALSTSTLLKKMNAKDYAGAEAEFKRWNQAGGKVLPGLIQRRAAEAAMFHG